MQWKGSAPGPVKDFEITKLRKDAWVLNAEQLENLLIRGPSGAQSRLRSVVDSSIGQLLRAACILCPQGHLEFSGTPRSRWFSTLEVPPSASANHLPALQILAQTLARSCTAPSRPTAGFTILE